MLYRSFAACFLVAILSTMDMHVYASVYVTILANSGLLWLT